MKLGWTDAHLISCCWQPCCWRRFPSRSAGSRAAAQGTAGKASDYVGSDACSDCHFAEFQQFQKTAMSAILSNKYPLEQRGCEACHGPGRAHTEGEKAEKAGKQPDLMSRRLPRSSTTLPSILQRKMPFAA